MKAVRVGTESENHTKTLWKSIESMIVEKPSINSVLLKKIWLNVFFRISPQIILSISCYCHMTVTIIGSVQSIFIQKEQGNLSNKLKYSLRIVKSKLNSIFITQKLFDNVRSKKVHIGPGQRTQ